ncbi:bifunctional diguanylate cyclase/phosphodiesterase [Halomonas salinarum]|uniref:bifunctional diguanylate cyclase/phosphodiesterase n=1 Tax=Halomonas salinarum TaxID=1158993 RepID=UPI00143BC37B|nr:EAL domain-containing protein [Halomonas salinarum]
MKLMEAQQEVHERIAQQAPLDETLAAIARGVEVQLPDAIVAFMRFDASRQTLSLTPNQDFSPAFQQSLQDVPIGPEMAAFGCAAFCLEPVITEDIRTDPRWPTFRAAAEREGLRSCWAIPVLTADDELLGTFSLYFREPRHSTDMGRCRLKQAAALMALAIVRNRDAINHRTLSEWHRSLFVNHPDGVYEFDLEGHFQRSNSALTRITGYPEETIIGRHFNDFVDPGYREFTQSCFDIARRGGSRQYETIGRHRDGYAVQLEVLNFPVSVDGEVVGVYGVCRDVTRQKQEEETRYLLERGIQATPNGMVMADASHPDMPLVYANDAFYTLTGYPSDEVLGRNCRFLQGPDTDPEAVMAIHRAIGAQQYVDTILLNYRKDGTTFWNHLSLSPVFSAEGDCTHYIGIQQDITQQHEQEAQLARQAYRDPLTDLVNRLGFTEAASRHIERYGWNPQTMIALLDIKEMRNVNDAHGYEAGDRLLIEMARRLEEHLSDDVLIGRISGDQFIVLMPVDDASRIHEHLDKLASILHQPLHLCGLAIEVAARGGYTLLGEEKRSAETLLHEVEIALHENRRLYSNDFHRYDKEMDRLAQQRIDLTRELRRALDDDQFELHYQPKVNLSTGNVIGCEALIRWVHPERGMLMPGQFVSIAEQSRLIGPIGEWVIFEACRHLREWQDAGLDLVNVSVNVSVEQLLRGDLASTVRQALELHVIVPSSLTLEITESIFSEESQALRKQLNDLHALGVRLSLDDFGTGYSSLLYLQQYPFDEIKIDMGFVRGLIEESYNRDIVSMILGISRVLGADTVAEGVENNAVRDVLLELGCRIGQGYYYGMPLEVEDFRWLLEKRSRLPLNAIPDATFT